jgi:hypothetical protein
VEIKTNFIEIFQVKVNGSNDEMLRAAAEQFGDKSVDEIMFGEFKFGQKMSQKPMLIRDLYGPNPIR